MINRKLIREVPEAKKHIICHVLYQLLSLVQNIFIILMLGSILQDLYSHTSNIKEIPMKVVLIILAIGIRFLCMYQASRESHLASQAVKSTFRKKMYGKMIQIGSSYTKKISTAEVVQVSVEGVEQLETYFGNYLPQLFYAMIAPIVLFVVVSFMNFKIACVLFCCVPMIPISIVMVQKIAKKLLHKYWNEYANLGDSFLENLQGLSTLKIYSADAYKQEQMNQQAERFRKITMRVLTMQLNSISVMDMIAYGGTSLGVVCSVMAYSGEEILLAEAFVIILLCADFFLPMRLLGSYFHIAMNGMAASKKMFQLLEIETEGEKKEVIEDAHIIIGDLGYCYDGEEAVVSKVSMEIKPKSMIALVGESGCGKSTIAGILAGVHRGYTGSITIGGKELSKINEKNLFQNITTVSLGSYLFKGTVKDNLLMGNEKATEEEMWTALEQVNLKAFLMEQDGLATLLLERGENFSGGQCQRLALARALLHNSSIYIFDEATSNIDAESENEIIKTIEALRKEKTVILISHRLVNVIQSDCIYVLEKGRVVESGTHKELLGNRKGKGENKFTSVEASEITGLKYKSLWDTQMELECMGGICYEP